MSATPMRAPVPLPDWGGEALWSTLKFLAVPGILAALIEISGLELPSWILYGIGGLLGLWLVVRIFRDPEWLLAIAILYLPLNMMFVVPLAPGLNGTNVLLALLLFSWFRHRPAETDQSQPRLSGSRLVGAYAIVTLISVLTAVFTVGSEFVLDHALDLKGWLDQFIVYFVFKRLIRDGNMARRMVVYMMIGSGFVLLLGFIEWLDKRGIGSMEKARLLGPQLQPNDFGAFLAYASAPFLALLLSNLRRWSALALAVPYLVVSARVLLATFSRGAYLGMALAGIVAGYVRGKRFLIGAALLLVGLLVAVPDLVPASLQARMSQTSAPAIPKEKLDSSSQTRLILWDAALKMTRESPLLGWGFKTFPEFKGNFTEVPVPETDNHNMYLYLSSQMGIPAVVLFCLILFRQYSLGVRIYRRSSDGFARVIGMSAAATAAAAFSVNMFGSRMVDICVSVYFWVMLAIVGHLWKEIEVRTLTEERT